MLSLDLHVSFEVDCFVDLCSAFTGAVELDDEHLGRLGDVFFLHLFASTLTTGPSESLHVYMC